MPMVRQPLSTEHILLGYVAERPMHGYELHQLVSDPEELGMVWRVKQAQLYSLLTKLEGDGLIQATLENQDPRPPRKIFHLTEAGKEVLDVWLISPVPHARELRIEFLAKLYFARRRGRDTLQHLLNTQRAAAEQWLAAQQAPTGTSPYRRLVHDFRVGQIHSILDWLTRCEQELT